MNRKDDPDLAPDAALAVEHTPERGAEQLSYLGGEVDDIDEFDPTGLDDGSELAPKPAPDEAPSNEVTEDQVDESEDEKEDAADDDGGSTEAAESDAERDGEPEEAEAEAEAEVAEPAQKGIPKHRFDEVNERRKAAEEELARYKAQQQAQEQAEEQTYDFRDNEKQYMDLLLDGDLDGALAKREEIDAAKEMKWRQDTKQETTTDMYVRAENDELMSLSKEAEQMFDVFNPDSESYSQETLDKVMVFMSGYESRNMNRPDAFVAALADVVEMYGLMDTVSAAEPKPEVEQPPPKVDKRKAKLKEEAVVPVAEAGSASAEAGAVVSSIEDMTDEELDALPEKTLARMRGDFL
jgi:hypothetical protein